MGLKALMTSAITVSVASGALAQSLDPVRIEMFRSILAGNECVLTEGAAANILPRFDFTRDETRAIVGALVAAGEVRLDGNTLNLVDGSCASEDPVADLLGRRDVQQFISVMAENGCAMTEAEGEAVFTARGISKAQVSDIVGPMMQNGMASFDAGQGVLSVSSAYCSPVVVSAEVEAPVELDRSGMFGLGRVRGLVDAMAANGCMLNTEVEDAYLAQAGIDFGFAKFIARKMLSDGFADMADEESLLLPPPYCIPTAGAAPVVVVEAPVVVAETPVEEEPGVDMAKVELMREIFAQNGCRLSEDQMGEILPAAGFSRADAGQVFNYLENSGELQDDNNDAVLVGGACAAGQAVVETTPAAPEEAPAVIAENDGSPEGVFLSVMAQNGCTMAEPMARDAFAAAGLRMDQAYLIAQNLVAAGDATYADDGATLEVSTDRCAQSDGPVVPVMTPVAPAVTPATPAVTPDALVNTPITPVDASDPRAAVLAMLAQNQCQITQANAADVISAAGLDFNASMQILSQMMASGAATSPDGGQTLLVPEPLCVSAAAAEPMTPRETFINLIKQNNCSITAAEFSSLLPVDGLDANTAFGMISELEAEGVITLPATRDVVTLSAEMCR